MLTPDEEAELTRLETAFEDAGGRGVDLAERIDALRLKRDIGEQPERVTRFYIEHTSHDDENDIAYFGPIPDDAKDVLNQPEAEPWAQTGEMRIVDTVLLTWPGGGVSYDLYVHTPDGLQCLTIDESLDGPPTTDDLARHLDWWLHDRSDDGPR